VPRTRPGTATPAICTSASGSTSARIRTLSGDRPGSPAAARCTRRSRERRSPNSRSGSAPERYVHDGEPKYVPKNLLGEWYPEYDRSKPKGNGNFPADRFCRRAPRVDLRPLRRSRVRAGYPRRDRRPPPASRGTWLATPSGVTASCDRTTSSPRRTAGSCRFPSAHPHSGPISDQCERSTDAIPSIVAPAPDAAKLLSTSGRTARMNDDRIADLPLTIESVATERLERETSSEFTRVTTVFSLSGPDPATVARPRVAARTSPTKPKTTTGWRRRGSRTSPATTPSGRSRAARGPRSLPGGEPDRDVFRNYRRWGLESAALDLALRRAETDLGSVLDRSADPVRFVASTRLGEPPTTDRLEALRERVPDLEFKLDPTPAWGRRSRCQPYRRNGRHRFGPHPDLKGNTRGPTSTPADPEAVRTRSRGVPRRRHRGSQPDRRDAAAVRGSRRSLPRLLGRTDSRSADIEALPGEPSWLNIKPSRFGSLESLLETIAHREEHDIRLYGGGQFELGVGRGQDSDGGVALLSRRPQRCRTAAYNDPAVGNELPRSPLDHRPIHSDSSIVATETIYTDRIVRGSHSRCSLTARFARRSRPAVLAHLFAPGSLRSPFASPRFSLSVRSRLASLTVRVRGSRSLRSLRTALASCDQVD